MENEVKVETKKKGNGLFTLFACIMTGIIVFLGTNLGQKIADNNDKGGSSKKDSNVTSNVESNTTSNVASNVTSNVESNITSNVTSNVVSNSNTNAKKVVKVDIDQKELDSKYISVFVNATAADGESVWTYDLGKIPVGTGVYTLGLKTIGNYVYLNNYGKLEKRDLQTGKIIWKSEQKENEYSTPTIVESNGKVYVESGMGAGYAVEILDANTGKSIKLIENIDSVIPEATGNNQHDFIVSSMTINGDTIIFDVNLNDATGKFVKLAGHLNIDVNTGKAIYIAA